MYLSPMRKEERTIGRRNAFESVYTDFSAHGREISAEDQKIFTYLVLLMKNL